MVFQTLHYKIDVLDDLEEIFFCVRYENGDKFSSVLAVQRDISPSMSKLRDGNVQRKMLTAGFIAKKCTALFESTSFGA